MLCKTNLNKFKNTTKVKIIKIKKLKYSYNPISFYQEKKKNKY